MARQLLWFYLPVIVFSAILASQAEALTDPLDETIHQNAHKANFHPLPYAVMALQDLYLALNSPPQLKGWRPEGGDPCNESWTGVSCSGKLHGQRLGGYLGGMLSNLHSLKQLDLACNYFSENIPYSLTSLMHLRRLDLSYNNFTGDLPSSFGSLTNLTKLFLQNNKFTGSVMYLADLPMSDLIGGNRFQVGANYPPWDFPLETVPTEQNFSSPPTTQSSAIENYPHLEEVGHKKKRMGLGGIAFMVGGGTLVVSCAALVIAIHLNRSRAQHLRRLENNDSSSPSLPINTVRDCAAAAATAPEECPQILSLSLSPALTPVRMPPARHIRGSGTRRRSFSKKCRIPGRVKIYTAAELQGATNNFSEENFLGEGSLGSVYKAEFPDGQIMAVRNINTVALSLQEEDQFLDVIWSASRLRHPNIVTLIGYCVEHGQHLLVYEYVKNLSLNDALHCEMYEPLPWGLRLQIALGIARALDYLHSTFSPPIAHSNLKATNILLDDELIPRICDCGLAVLRPLMSNSVKLKASEMAIGNAGYIVPEHGQPGNDNTKSDIYAFGVLLLELLTGRKAFDSSRPKEEQTLAKWASSQLHDSESLQQMVGHGIKKTVSTRALSQFADIVSLCIQPEKEFRPAMSEIVESLTSLLQMSETARSSSADSFEISFCSTHTGFVGSPTMSFFSV
ncbi:hypothetical protein L1049_008646 [Liquidambar formosana]|uniref:Protein kinase domain-containing protein n=1 Tax=Liquidambar formosana TaxID=63359 RepID=A0AAP0SA56_LIQFO